MRNALFVFGFALVACSKDAPVPTNPPTPSATVATTSDEPLVGKAAPEINVVASDGAKLASNDLKGKFVVIYFYPKDETPGCTKEACAFRDSFDPIAKKAVLIGVSADDDASHKAFAEHHKLPFHLVSDPNGDLGKKFGVPFGEKYPNMHARQTIVIAPDGTVKKIYRSVDVTKHATEILGDIG